MMRLLVLITMMMAGCSSPYNLSAHRPTSRWAKVRGPITVIHLVESLTPEQARGVAKDRKGTLYLPDLRTIDKGVAAVLAAWERGGKSLLVPPLDSSDHRSGEQEPPVSPEKVCFRDALVGRKGGIRKYYFGVIRKRASRPRPSH